MGVKESQSEKVIRGSNEGFAESIKVNTALIRKRLRTPKVKVKESFAGRRSYTNVNLVFMEDLIHPDLLQNIEERLKTFEIDGVPDRGIIEQLTEGSWLSPFPQFQTTQRPDRAAMAIFFRGRTMLRTTRMVAMVAMMPLITVQIMGLIYVVKTKHAAEAPEYPYADDDVIELWEA